MFRPSPAAKPAEAGSDQRLHNEREFGSVIREGLFARGSVVNLWVLRRAENGPPRLGLIVSRKTDPRATRRNLWKRRMRAVFRSLQPGIVSGSWVVIQSSGREGVPATKELRAEIEKLLKQTKSLTENRKS